MLKKKMEEDIVLQREGYGATMNRLTIDNYHKTITKTSVNEEGHRKISLEMSFYSTFFSLGVSFPVPKIFHMKDNSYTMNYYDNYTAFADNFSKTNLIRIFELLENLHKETRVNIPKDIFYERVKEEVVYKIIERFQSFEKEFLPTISNIHFINGYPFPIFEKAVAWLWSRIESLLEHEEFSFSLLHGDCNFQNILIGPHDEIIFIDPRGYFGKTTNPFGLPAYDRAKVVFALTGYDIFDRMKETPIIKPDEKGNVSIESLALLPNALDFCGPLEKYLALSIWLGNAHVFWKAGFYKKATFSYLYAMGLLSQSQRSDGII